MNLYRVHHGAILLIGIICIPIYGRSCSSSSSSLPPPRLTGISFFSPRSQSTNAARDLAGWHPFIHRYDVDSVYAAFTFTPAYYRSVRVERISEALFGRDSFNVTGSFVNNRMNQDMLADYFGLSPTFESTVSLKPRIQNAMAICNAFVGLDAVASGVYITAMVPFVWTQWNLHLAEAIFNEGADTPFPPLYMDLGAVQAPAKSFIQALKGHTTFGQMQQPLAFGKIDGGHSKIGVSDIQLAFGWDFILREHGHAGLNLRMSAPTGSRPNSEFLFEPIVGNGKHWELGLGFSGKVLLWEQDGVQTWHCFVDANLTHLFKARQRRSFDLKCNGFGSRYILLKEFDSTGNYTGNLAPTINKTTLDCKVQIDVELDFVVMFGYTSPRFVFDIGYNGWVRSKEKISLDASFTNNAYGLKGIQNVSTGAGTFSNTTQSTATLMGNYFPLQPFVADFNSPVFITKQNLNLDSAASPRLVTHKFFTYFGYAFPDSHPFSVQPIAGVGGEIEFEGVNPRNIVLPPVRTTLSQWGVWLKLGFAFP